MQVREVMTKPVLSIEAEAPITNAIRLMLQKKISGLPVVDADGQLVGLVSEGDFLRRAETGTQPKRPRWLEFLMGPGQLAEQYARSHGRKVSDVMTAPVHAVGPDAALEDVVALMERHRIKRVPVVSEGRPVGIVTRANLLRALAGVAHELAPSAGGDAAIREAILETIAREKWAPAASVDAIVRDGVVTLSGCVLDERQRGALKVLAENVPGVKAVHDRLVWIEPMSGTALEPEALRATAATPARGT
jgi:CBS domain-containing protein